MMIVAFPLIALTFGILLELAMCRLLSRAGKGWLAFASDLVALVAVMAMIPRVMAKGTLDQTLFSWDQGILLTLHADGLSLVFALMATGIGCPILLYAVNYMSEETEGVTRFYLLMLTFIGGLVLLVLSANMLMTYVSWEVIGLCSYFLVGFWYKESAAVNGARKVLVMTHLAGYGLLVAVMLLYTRSGTFLWTDPAMGAAFGTGVFLLMLVSAMAKSVQFPLHTWIPEAMNAPTPVSALLHSACYVKAGVYLIARMYSFGPWHISWNEVVLVIGSLTMAVGVLFALIQTDIKRLLAFHTVSQLGYMMTGLGLGTSLGVAAGLFYCVSHGLFKSTLFLCAGAVQKEAHTRDLRRLGGLFRSMPYTATIWLIGAAAISGVPLFNGFVAKWLIYDAALVSGHKVVIFVAWMVSIFTALSFLKATATIFFGDMPARLQAEGVSGTPPAMKVGMGALGGACLLFGIVPQILIYWGIAPAVEGLGFRLMDQVSWLGVRTTSAGVQVTLGAGIAAVALLGGLALYQLSRAPRIRKRAAAGVFTGGDPLPEGDDMVSAVDFIAVAETTFAPVYRAADPDPVYFRIWRYLTSAAEGLARILTPVAEGHAFWATGLMAAAVFVAVWLR
jgi:multicomponent K+:H+ antiporter subunit A